MADIAIAWGMRILPTLLFAAAFLAAFTSAQAKTACALPTPCEVTGENGGTYYVAAPEDWDGNGGLKPFVFYHGHSGSGAGVAKNKGLAKSLAEQGYLLIAPDGPMLRYRNRETRGWPARVQGEIKRSDRNDVKFTEAVLRDVAQRFKLNLDDTVISGFSSGGSMAWHFSCYSTMQVAGVVPVAGALRRPHPNNGVVQADGSIARFCPGGPRKVVHIHGWSDKQVPLEGRGIGEWHQGDVFASLDVQRRTNRCNSRPDMVEAKGPFWCRAFTSCETGQAVKFCLHPGGHGMPQGWLETGLNGLSNPGN
ncbi:putative polyhydroxybutyrate depolymerase [Ahrensia sp. R2A130]|nr:putative polyhydroxybutyrate depolymerase [Ahrensia sp. R2A130]